MRRQLGQLVGSICKPGAGPDGSRLFSQVALTNTGVAAGRGGRSSVSGVTATVFGCSGFLARYVVQSLARMGSQVVLPYRCDDLDVQHLKPMGDLGQVVTYPSFDLRDGDMIAHAISRSNVVINLVGAHKQTWNYSFREVHVDIPRRIAEAVAKQPGVERFMHVSCLGAKPDAPSERLRTKAEGDAVVRELLPWATTFKSAHFIGQEDVLSNLYAKAGKKSPAALLVDGGAARLQPVYVRDVADAIFNSLYSQEARGSTYHLAGPEVMTLHSFVQQVHDTMREPFNPIHVPFAAMKYPGQFWDWVTTKTPPVGLVSPLMSADFLSEMTVDHVLPAPDAPELGGQPLLTLRDLNVEPTPIIAGTPFEHIRHLRAGGYDLGTTLEK